MELIAAHPVTETSAVFAWSSWREPIYLCLVPMFFALSGFLVTGSALRTRNIRTFLCFRGLRIFPALTVEITLSALVLGVFFTTLPAQEYFTHPDFFKYFGNIIGYVSYYLPGVFESSPVKGIVNNSLWTLPAEFYCYLLTTAIMFTKWVYDRRQFTILFMVVTIGLCIWGIDLRPIHGNMPTPIVVYYFFVGVFLFHWKDRIPSTFLLMLGAAGVSYALIYYRAPLMLTPFFLSYMTIAIGMLALPRIPIFSKNDYSYGIYLYGFPITQAVRELTAGQDLSQIELRGSALLITMLFAAASWHGIERHALKLKRYVLPPKTTDAKAVLLPVHQEQKQLASVER